MTKLHPIGVIDDQLKQLEVVVPYSQTMYVPIGIYNKQLLRCITNCGRSIGTSRVVTTLPTRSRDNILFQQDSKQEDR